MKRLFNRFVNKRANTDIASDLLKQTNEAVEAMDPINILVAGKTGAGKSTLINALFRENLAETGVGQPLTQGIQRITKEGVPLVLYDTQGLELMGEAQHEVLTQLNELIQRLKQTSKRETLDLVYYVLHGGMGRIEAFEIELIRALAEQLPVIIVLSQAIGSEVQDFVAYLEGLKLPVAAIQPILAKPYLIHGEQFVEKFGLQELIDTSIALIPESTKRAFINAQQVDLKLKVKEARSWANSYITTAFGVGFTPIPMADSAILVPMQIGMLAHITSIFGLSLDYSQIVSIIAGIGGTGGATFLGKYIVSSAFKVIPGLGTVSGGLLSGATASALTMALAYSYIEVLKQIAEAEAKGIKIPLVDIQAAMNKYLKQQLNEVAHLLPDAVKDNLLPEWLRKFIK